MPYFRNIPYTSTSHFLKEAHVKGFLFPLFPNVNLKILKIQHCFCYILLGRSGSMLHSVACGCSLQDKIKHKNKCMS